MENEFSNLYACLEGHHKFSQDQQDPTFAITTWSGTITKDPPYRSQPHTNITAKTEASHKEAAKSEWEFPETPTLVTSPIIPPST